MAADRSQLHIPWVPHQMLLSFLIGMQNITKNTPQTGLPGQVAPILRLKKYG